MKIIKDIYYTDTESKSQRLDIYLPDSEEFKVFIYFHGGGLEAGDKDGTDIIGKDLAQQNIAFVTVNYRMYPTAVYPEFIRDCAAAVAWVFNHINEYGKCSGIYVGGSSAGGYLSMMLCFDKKYLAPYGINPTQINGYIHDAGQPTSHFNIMRERGLDTRRVIIDESSPIYHIGTADEYSPMIFIVSDDDMENRYEQTVLAVSTLKHFEYDQSKIELKVMHGGHCHYVGMLDESGKSVFADMVADFINKH